MTYILLPDIQAPSVANIDVWSFSLQWNGSPPELTGNPPRNITQYAVTVSQQDSEDPQIVYVPAVTDASCVVTGLQPETKYDIQTSVVIDTDGQGEQTHELGIHLITVNTAATSSK